MKTLLTPFKYGQIFVSDKDFYIGRTLIASGQYCDEEMDIFRQILTHDDNVIEVGANIGCLSVPISQLVGKIYAIEPQEFIFHMLCANMIVNNCRNLEPMNIAIGDTNGNVRLPILDYNAMNNFGGIEIKPGNMGKEVPLKTLDETFKNLTSLKLIKIDVEGMEREVLNGGQELIKQHRPFIYCENDREEIKSDLLNKLSSIGYTTYNHISHVFNIPNFKNREINIFDKNYICLNVLAIPQEKGLENIKF